MNRAFDKKFGADFLDSVPRAPGVYRYYDRNDTLVYVGKAKDLRQRLAQYRNAQQIKPHRKMRKVVRAAVRLEFETTETEADALRLENEIIQMHRPRLNVDGAFTFLYPTIGLKRDARYLHVACTTQADELVAHGFRPFGCYRNRLVTRAGFDALVELLTWLGHVEGAEELLPYTLWRRFRQVPESLDTQLADLLLGNSDAFLQSAILLLVDKAVARRNPAEVQAALEAVKTFYDMECVRLAGLLEVSGEVYIANELRDQATIDARFAPEPV